MLRPIFAVLPLDIRSLGYRARAAAWGSADAALRGVQRFSAATARRGVARVLRPVAALPGCVARAAACGSTWAAGSGVQHFWLLFSCEFRLGGYLAFVCGPSRGCAKEFGFFDPRRPGQIYNHGFCQLQIQGAFFHRHLQAR